MKHIKLKNITKTYNNGYTAINHISLEINKDEFIVIVGPSGCGKTTLLKLIAGLEPISSGELFINNQPMNNVESRHRNISMVFQNYPLFNHMTVFENILFGVKLKKYNIDEIRKDIFDLACKLSIQDLLNYYPSQLSGGQKQRVALARSLICKPEILLMDEPLSSLDVSLKLQLRQLIKELHQYLHTTFIYVTHDQNEALLLATRLIVLKDGVIMQDGTPEEIYRNPKNLFVANFISQYPINLLECQVNQNKQIQLNDYLLNIHQHINTDTLILGIKPEDFEVVEKNDSMFEASIHHIETMGSDYLIYVIINNKNCLIRTHTRPLTKEINISIKHYYLFDKKTNIRI